MARNEVIQIRVTTQEKDKWKDAAASQHMELSAWIRLVLDKATRPGATDQQTQFGYDQ